MNNFECPVTKKQFEISAYKTRVDNGIAKYYKSGPGWEQLLGPAGQPLVKLHLAEVPLLAVKTGDGLKA